MERKFAFTISPSERIRESCIHMKILQISKCWCYWKICFYYRSFCQLVLSDAYDKISLWVPLWILCSTGNLKEVCIVGILCPALQMHPLASLTAYCPMRLTSVDHISSLSCPLVSCWVGWMQGTSRRPRGAKKSEVSIFTLWSPFR